MNLLAHYSYSPFGEVLEATGSQAANNRIRFSSKHWDDETGLGCWGRRYYHPDLGRWTSRDPGQERQGRHLYAFVQNQPTFLIDLFGLYPGNPTHGAGISPEDSVMKILGIQESSDAILDQKIQKVPLVLRKWYSKTRNALRLYRIATTIGTAENNKFVFTCKHGWIDHGHFFNNAVGVYALAQIYGAIPVPWSPGISAGMAAEDIKTIANLNEFVQQYVPQFVGPELGEKTDPTSAWGPEDLISNELGREFAKRMVQHDGDMVAWISLSSKPIPASKFFHVAVEWRRFLRASGAVKWTAHSEPYLLADQKEFWSSNPGGVNCGTSIEKAMQWYRSRPLWQCVCGGDVARDLQDRY